MAGADAFQIEGVVTEALPNGTYHVVLANGHRLLGFVTGRARQDHVRFGAGDRVRLQLTPYDLSRGRILVATRKISV